MPTTVTGPGVRRITDLLWAADLRSQGYRIRRAWPRSADHLLLELIDDEQNRIAGQWFADQRRAQEIAARTPGSTRTAEVVLQPDGADRRLTALAGLLAHSDHRLIAHRPERRAVLRVGSAAGRGAEFVKVLPPAKLARPALLARAAERLGIGAPALLDIDAERGLLTTAALPGRPLTDLLAGPAAAQACHRAGELLARLHGLPLSAVGDLRPALSHHGPDEERAVLHRWQRLADAYRLHHHQPDQDQQCQDQQHRDHQHRDQPHPARHHDHQRYRDPQPQPDHRPDHDHLWNDPSTPEILDSGRRVLVHRDFHDGQLLLDTDSIGVLDFDLMAIGDPALDLANLLAQLELRAAQGVLADPVTAREAVLAGYRPDPGVRAAVPGYLSSARARLRAVYAFRAPELPS